MTTNQSRPRPLQAALQLWRTLLLAEQRAAAMCAAVHERHASTAVRHPSHGHHCR